MSSGNERRSRMNLTKKAGAIKLTRNNDGRNKKEVMSSATNGRKNIEMCFRGLLYMPYPLRIIRFTCTANNWHFIKDRAKHSNILMRRKHHHWLVKRHMPVISSETLHIAKRYSMCLFPMKVMYRQRLSPLQTKQPNLSIYVKPSSYKVKILVWGLLLWVVHKAQW